jgi:hypothetical protein
MGKKDLLEYHQVLCGARSKRSGARLAASTINDRFHNACYLLTLLYREGMLKEDPAQGIALDLPGNGLARRRPLT